jgi:hypothetical protein
MHIETYYKFYIAKIGSTFGLRFLNLEASNAHITAVTVQYITDNYYEQMQNYIT